MVNLDYPGVCMACVDERCEVTPPDLNLSRERVHSLAEGFDLTLVHALKDTFSDKFSSPEEAYQVYDAMKAIIVNGLKIHSAVDLEGIGMFKSVRRDGPLTIDFEPDPKLTDHHHDTSPPDIDRARDLLGNTKGYTLTTLKVIRETFPDKVTSVEDAFRVYYVMRALLANELEKGEVKINGIGTLRSKEGKAEFTPEQVLESAVNE
ncbi:MAG: hypothetical protein ACOC24_04680 [Desulfovibrionales bacterium]